MGSNSNGSGFEACVEGILKAYYEDVVPQWVSGWTGLFGGTIRCDFYCDEKIVYEVKFQDVSGSVEQKLVHSVEQIKQCHQLPTVLILGGSGYSRGCMAWALQQGGGGLMSVQTVDQFVASLVRKGR